MKHTKAWAAGLFEGEGTISKRKGPRPEINHLWQIRLSSTDEDIVLAFHAVVGVGKVYGPYGYVNDTNRRREHHKPYWQWAVSDKKGIEAFAKMVGPYLLSRRKAKLDECLEGVAQTPTTRAPHTRRPKEAP